MQAPLVSIICLCYNHERFVSEALESVINQTYQNIQIIIVDDASTDGSKTLIQKIINNNPSIQFISLTENQGICKAFNRALALAKGDYIIDFATDDVMEPEKIKHQIDFFSRLNKSYGVIFTDAIYIDANGKFIRNHFEHLFKKRLLKHIPEGDVYCDVLSTYFIPSPSMMVRREVFDELKGYDENLSYEDFDFWIRSSRKFKYAYLNERLVKIRLTSNSMSTGAYRIGNKQLYSTYVICKKAQGLVLKNEEREALVKRTKYELRQSVFSENIQEVRLFYQLLIELNELSFVDKLLYNLNHLRLPLSFLRKWYHQIKYAYPQK